MGTLFSCLCTSKREFCSRCNVVTFSCCTLRDSPGYQGRSPRLLRCAEPGICYWNQFSRENNSVRQRSLHGKRRSRAGAPAPHTKQKSSRPTRPCDGPRMNPSVDVGNPPRPFRHLRVAERCSPDPSSSRVPVHSALVQKSVTAITNPAGRLSIWMLGKSRALGKWKTAKSWQAACNQSNEWFPNGLASGEVLEGLGVPQAARA